MPPDPSSEARMPMLSTSLSPSPSPLPSPSRSPSPKPPSPRTDGPVPPWVRSNSHTTSGTNSRRLSTPYSRANDDAHLSFVQRMTRTGTDLTNKALKIFWSLTPLQRVGAVLTIIALDVLVILFLVYSHSIFAALESVAEGWRALPGGWILVFLLTCLTAFPPMIGYSTCVTIAGFLYDFPDGWPVAASATVLGSLAAFLASRTVLGGYVDRLVGGDTRFVAFGQVLRRDGLLVLAAIRFCPLPFSLSNGFLATVPSITPLRFALATAASTPKLLVHVFIGSRLARLAESGDKMSFGDRAINYLSMFIGSAVGIALSLFIYRRTMARAKELAREEAAENGIPVGEDGELDYDGLEEGVLNGSRSQRHGELDEAALMDDDDISLWETDDIAMGYRDEDSGEEAGGFENGHSTKGRV
ncbi:uncharacterized protein F4822DRAFT_419783 [Hypoxylon trugodes]|uniref:uncharacterized protein n=1 Tax=Hypoxylon trugodes TaxID=326681 RepID=UPI002191155F|nr:uncharacterized protein F4822DRAFT_419783 [Hypoxylon trugodes]KAI1383226.1 hypothetical protein F4822DRAFT_419783 [Hypoxylon trugodes]